MYSSLKLVKVMQFAWIYYPNGLSTGFAISKGYFSIDEDSGTFQIVEDGRAKRPAVNISNITIQDLTDVGTIEGPFNSATLQNRLTILNCPLSINYITNDAAVGPGTPGTMPVFNGIDTIGDSELKRTGLFQYIIDAGRALLSGSVNFSFQRSQSQIDIVLGNPGISQPSEIWSDNDQGLLVKSKGVLSFLLGATYNKIFNLPSSKPAGTYTLATLDDIGSGATPTQDEVTAAGNTIVDKDLIIEENTNGNLIVRNVGGDESIISSQSINSHNQTLLKSIGLSGGVLYYLDEASGLLIQQAYTTPTSNRVITHRDKSGTVAHLDDIPAPPTYKVIAKKATASSPVTAVTTEQILEVIPYLANDAAVGDIIRAFYTHNKSVSTGTTTIRLRHNTVNNLTGSNVIATSGALASGTRSQSFQRHLNVRTGVIEHVDNTVAAAFENAGQSSVRGTTTFNPTIDNWFFITCQNNTQATDSTVCSNYIFEKL